MKIFEWIKYAKKILLSTNTPRLDIEILLSYVLGKSKTWIYLFDDFTLNNKQIIYLKQLLFRRIHGEPIAYIIQKKEFWSLSFFISKDVLIPRPETEILVEEALCRISSNTSILDLGTGCGNISISIAHEHSNCNIVGVDCDSKAILIAKKNAKFLNCNNVSFFYSHWFSNIHQKFHMIVSNPPYLSHHETEMFSKDIFYEPYTALFSLKYGISDIEYIISNAKKYLFIQGWLLIEHGCNQVQQVTKLFRNNNFYNIQSYTDYSNIFRLTVGQKKY
ncbi:peptide chain release factor N(5)-glutamine methyltransferase [Buchnera aphidicola]|uniref:peptide chain release factor N(5)-glutamine methyltransferase n=1 Tax=Buchnera aphidicola TaxID=9 RepID=UPI003464C0C4